MSDWQVGDLAVCVDARPHPTYQHRGDGRLQEGKVYRVASVHCGRLYRHSVTGVYGNCALEIEGVISFSPSRCWRAERFRKIRPDEHEACEPEFVTLLKRVKVHARGQQVSNG